MPPDVSLFAVTRGEALLMASWRELLFLKRKAAGGPLGIPEFVTLLLFH